MYTQKRVLVVTAVVVGSLLSGLANGTATAAVAVAAVEDTATVYLVQGVPGTAVDMAVDGKSVAQDVPTTTVIGPIAVGAGTRTITFTDTSGKVLAENTLAATAGGNSDLVLH